MIELMIVVALVAILASIAMPSYTRYIEKSEARAASADLVALSLVLENQFQKKLVYPTYSNVVIPAALSARSSEMKEHFSAWTPSKGDKFTYHVKSDAGAYTVSAVRIKPGCTLTLNSSNVRNDAESCSVLGTW